MAAYLRTAVNVDHDGEVVAVNVTVFDPDRISLPTRVVPPAVYPAPVATSFALMPPYVASPPMAAFGVYEFVSRMVLNESDAKFTNLDAMVVTPTVYIFHAPAAI